MKLCPRCRVSVLVLDDGSMLCEACGERVDGTEPTLPGLNPPPDDPTLPEVGHPVSMDSHDFEVLDEALEEMRTLRLTKRPPPIEDDEVTRRGGEEDVRRLEIAMPIVIAEDLDEDGG